MRSSGSTAEHARVLVVGGGVAGASACIALARAGVRPHWLVRERSPASNPVGESLSPAALPILESLGLGEIAGSPRHRPANVTFSAWGSPVLMERNAFLHLEGPGRVIDRCFFEEQLQDAAEVVATKVVGTFDRMGLYDKDASWSVILDSGEALTADFVIDATGRAALIGRRQSRFERIDKLVAATAFLRRQDREVEPTRATLIEAVPQGWWYATLLPDQRLGLAFFSDPDLLPRGLPRDLTSWKGLLADTLHVGRWVQEAGFSVETPPRLASAGSARLTLSQHDWHERPGWAAIGDAVAAFDPLSSHGLTTALWTASRMGTVVPAWLSGDSKPMAAYGRAVASGFTAFLLQREAIYGREGRYFDQPFWQRRRWTPWGG